MSKVLDRVHASGYIRGLLVGVLLSYIHTGLYLGIGMERNIPAMNAAGVLYYAAIWPAFIASGAYGAPAPYIPSWTFSHNGRG